VQARHRRLRNAFWDSGRWRSGQDKAPKKLPHLVASPDLAYRFIRAFLGSVHLRERRSARLCRLAASTEIDDGLYCRPATPVPHGPFSEGPRVSEMPYFIVVGGTGIEPVAPAV
jgi:hypothetical protein